MDEYEPREYIEVTIFPSGRADLMEFTTALTAFNKQYKQWLIEKGFDSNNKDLRLNIEKVQQGSIKIWITKNKSELFDTMEGFYKEYLEDFLKKLSQENISEILTVPLQTLLNTRSLIRWKVSFKYVSKNSGLELKSDLSIPEKDTAQKNLSKLISDRDVDERKSEIIKFVGFHKNKNAKTIAPDISDNEQKTFLAPDVRDFFLKEADNFMHPEKEYLVDLEVVYRRGTICSYNVKKIIGT